MFKRLFNLTFALTLIGSVYMTFAVKNNVYDMQKEVRSLKAKISSERETISVYRAEWASVSSASNIAGLQEQLFPNYKTVAYQQMQVAEILGTDNMYVASAETMKPKEISN